MTATVPTARGTLVDVDELGDTLMHEHVFVLNAEIELNYPGRWDEEVRRKDAVAKLQSAFDSGVRTIVDLTVLGLGRNVARIIDVAQQVDVNIILATGLYTYDDVPMFFKFRGPGLLIDGPELLSEFFIRDLTEGIAGTGVRAAIIKCATDAQGVTPGVERVLRATAHAHNETGAPITTHTHAGTERGLEQIAVFAEEGVDFSKVVIGHSGDTTDIDYLLRLLDSGAYIGMDRFGLDLMLPFEDRVATVATLCERGHANQIVLSHDSAAYSHNWEVEVKRDMIPNWHYEHIHRDVLPALRARGVSEPDIRQMLVANPADIFR
jgi:phosphotriesterase-related protein